MKDVSLMIVTFRGDELLKACLDSLLRVYGSLPETVVVDNAALDSTRSLVGGYPGAKYVSAPENLGFAGGNNLGLPLCTKKYLVLLNNDTEFTADSISPLIGFMDAHPNCGAVQGKVHFAAEPGLLDGCGGFFSPVCTLAFRGGRERDAGQFDEPARVFCIGGCFFMTSRAAIDAAGGLFYDHFRSYYEEIDFCHRLNLAGLECWYLPTPPILHRHSVTMAKFNYDDILKQYYRNINFSFRTCFGFPARLRFCATLALLSLGQSVVALLRGRANAAKIHLSVIRALRADRALIRETRKRLAAVRRVSDRELLAFAVRGQPWSYYLSLIRRG